MVLSIHHRNHQMIRIILLPSLKKKKKTRIFLNILNNWYDLDLDHWWTLSKYLFLPFSLKPSSQIYPERRICLQQCSTFTFDHILNLESYNYFRLSMSHKVIFFTALLCQWCYYNCCQRLMYLQRIIRLDRDLFVYQRVFEARMWLKRLLLLCDRCSKVKNLIFAT